MRRVLWHLAMVILLAFNSGSAVFASGPDVLEVRALNAFVEAWPRQPITLLARVTNNSERSLHMIPSVQVPDGWCQVLPAPPMILEAGETHTAVVTLLPVATAAAGDYSIRLEYNSPGFLWSADTCFTVHLMPDTTIDASLLNAPTYASNEPYLVEFVVHNSGNASHSLYLRTEENLGFKTHVEPTSLDLSPGASATVVLRAEVDDRYGVARQHRVQLIVSDRESSKALATESCLVVIVPQVISKLSAYHLFPLHITARFESGSEGVSSAWSLYGRGQLASVSSSQLRVNVTQEKQFLSLSFPNFRLDVGDQEFYLSSLTEDGTVATGLDIRSTGRTWLGQLLWGVDKDLQKHVGLRTAFHVAPQAAIALNYLRRPSALADLRSVESTLILSEELSARIEYGCQTAGPGQVSDPTAISLSGGFSTGRGDTIVEWQRSDAGYREAPKVLGTFSLRHRIDVGKRNAFSFHWQQQERFSDGIASPVERSVTDVGGSVRGELPAGTWTLSGAQKVITEQSDENSQFLQHLAFSLFQRLSESSLLSFSVGYERNHSRSKDMERAWLPLRLYYQRPLHTGVLGAFFKAEHTLRGYSQGTLGFGVGWTRQTNNLAATLQLSANDVLRQDYTILGRAEYPMKNGHRLQGRIAYSWRGDTGRKSLETRIGYVWPLSLLVPVGLRSDVGRVQGRILDEDGFGVEGIIVRLSGQMVRTQPDGSYCFPAVPVGEGLLAIAPEEIGADRVMLPSVPVQVKVKAGETVEQDFRHVRAARLHGTVRILRPPSDARSTEAVFGEAASPQVDLSVLKGIVIELRNESQVHRRLIQIPCGSSQQGGTDAGGTSTDGSACFQFDELLPGTWQLVVHQRGLPETYEVEVDLQTIHLGPGERHSVIINVVPRERRIKFVDNDSSEVIIVSPSR